jgi:hypothetical protein
MAGMSNYLAGKIYDLVLQNTAYTPPATVYVGLYTAAPTDAGGGTEVSGNAYARKAVTMGADTNGVGSNSAQVLFDAATPSGWGNIVAVGIFDASSAGNLLFWSTISSTAIAANDQAKLDTGTVTVTIDSA